MVGVGEAAAIVLEAGLLADVGAEVASVLGAIEVDDTVGRPGTGPLAMGALPYDRSADGRLVVPSLLYG